MQRCVPRLGRTRHIGPTPTPFGVPSFSPSTTRTSRQQCRTLKHDPEPARQQYLAQIQRGLDSDSLIVDPEARTISTAVGPLPISPLMDPAWLEATRRWRHHPKLPEGGRPKHKQSDGETPKSDGGEAENGMPSKQSPKGNGKGRFRSKLERNPYAQALATPVRRCVRTFLPIPRFFLQGFGVVHNPDTNSNWWAPKGVLYEVEGAQKKGLEEGLKGERLQDAGLESKSMDGEKSTSETEGVAEEDQELNTFSGEAENMDNEEDYLSTDAHGQQSNPSLTEAKTRLYDPSAYLLLRQDAIRPDAKRKFTLRVQLPNWTSISARSVMRQDMDELVLRMRRREAIASLLYLARLHGEGRQYLTGCSGWGGVGEYRFRGCLLWTRPSSEKVEEPAPFATYDILGAPQFDSRVPVHNLHYLLGDEGVDELKKESGLFREHWLLMLGRRRSVDAQMQLWQLQGYLLASWPGSDLTKQF